MLRSDAAPSATTALQATAPPARPGLGSAAGWHRASTLAQNAVAIGIVLLLWELAVRLVDSVFFPGPGKVWSAFVGLLQYGDVLGNPLSSHMWASTVRVMAGFAIGVLTAVPLGLLMGLYRPLYAGTRAAVEPFRFIPPIAWIPLTIVLLSGFQRYAFIIWLGVFFPVFVTTLAGVPRVDMLHRNVAKVHGASKLWIVRHVVIPSVLPDIFGGMRVGMGTAWMTLVAAELTGGESVGLGKLMVMYAELIRIPEIIVGMILIGVIGFSLNEVMLRMEHRLFRWRHEVKL